MTAATVCGHLCSGASAPSYFPASMAELFGKLKTLDAFPKVNEDFYQRTLSGGVITVGSSLLMLALFLSEFSACPTCIKRACASLLSKPSSTPLTLPAAPDRLFSHCADCQRAFSGPIEGRVSHNKCAQSKRPPFRWHSAALIVDIVCHVSYWCSLT